MSKYILTLLLCLSSHTLAATNHTQTTPSSLKEKQIITQSSEKTTPLPSKKCRPSFLKHFWGYCGLTLPGVLTILCSYHLSIKDNALFSELSSHDKWNSTAIIISLLGLLMSLGIAFTAAHFYTKSHKARKYSLKKHTIGFFALCVEGFLATLSSSYLVSKIKFLGLVIPTLITLLLCAISALIYVYYFHGFHEEVSNPTEASKHSFWETFFGYFTLTLPGALTMLCSIGWIHTKTTSTHFSSSEVFTWWGKGEIVISVLGLLMSLGIAFIAAYFYTKSHKAYKHSLKKHTIGFFALCVEGYLAILLLFLIDYLKNSKSSLLTFVIPIITSLSICAISAKLYVDSFNKRHKEKAEEKQAIKSVP